MLPLIDTILLAILFGCVVVICIVLLSMNRILIDMLARQLAPPLPRHKYGPVNHETTVSQKGTKSDQYKRAAQPIVRAGVEHKQAEMVPSPSGSQIITTTTPRQRQDEEDVATQERLDKWMPGAKRGQ